MVETSGIDKPVRTTHRPPSPEELYAALPAEAKRDLHDLENKRTNEDINREGRRKSQLIQSLIEGVFLYLPVEFFLYGLSILSTITVVTVGLLLGWVWNRIWPGPAAAGLIAIMGFLAIRMVCGMGFVFHAIIAMMFIICVSFAIWITRASERMGV